MASETELPSYEGSFKPVLRGGAWSHGQGYAHAAHRHDGILPLGWHSSGGFRTLLRKPSFRGIRGGSWNYGPSGVRPTSRDRSSPEFRTSYLGFRISSEY